MSEFRRDSLTGRWALISPERLRRPLPRTPKAHLKKVRFTPKLVASMPVAGRSDAVEVHRHKYPAIAPFTDERGVSPESVPDRAGRGISYMLRFASGRDLADVDAPRREAFAATAARYLGALHADSRAQTVLLFRNHGPRAGATLAQPHHQLWGIPVPSTEDTLELAWVKQQRTCPTCALLKTSRTFTVAQLPGAQLIARPAARFGAELAILPRVHKQSFASLGALQQADVVALLARGIRCLRKAYGDVGITEVWREPAPKNPRLHARIELLPRLSAIAGLELGSGVYLNPHQPEKIAAKLRSLRGVTELS